MQVACENYPDGSCDNKSVQDNVNAGASVLMDNLSSAGGNIILAMGWYNGWFTAGSGLNGNRGITKDYPCSDEGKSHGDPQNLDYVMQVLNGWFLGMDVYGSDSWIGEYRELCPFPVRSRLLRGVLIVWSRDWKHLLLDGIRASAWGMQLVIRVLGFLEYVKLWRLNIVFYYFRTGWFLVLSTSTLSHSRICP
jgi:hypothetical protein